MKTKRYDNMKFGLLLGLIGPLIGFFIYGSFWAWRFAKTLSYFVNEVFIGTPALRSSIIALSIIINLVPFLIFLRQDRYKSARGVLAAVFIYVPFVVYFRFNA